MRSLVRAVTIAIILLSGAVAWPQQGTSRPQLFEIALGPDMAGPVSGRLIIEAIRIVPLPDVPNAPPGAPPGRTAPSAAGPDGIPNATVGALTTVRLSPEKGGFHMAAYEIENLAPGKSVTVNADVMAWPIPFSQLPPGDYVVRAQLDVDHGFNVDQIAGADLRTMPRLRITLPSDKPGLEFTSPPRSRESIVRLSPEQATEREQMKDVELESRLLSDFHGKPIKLRAKVVPPPGYDSTNALYPAVYSFRYYAGSGLGTSQRLDPEHRFMAMQGGALPNVLHVLLDQSAEYGTHMWADSANNGPWSTALVEELIPHLEKTFRIDARPEARFLFATNAGGWPALWQQVSHPKLFGGVWVVEPEIVGVRDFMQTDLTVNGANVFRTADDSPKYMIRNASPENWSSGDVALPPRVGAGEPWMTTQSFEQMERVRGETGGRIASYEAIFSPRGANRKPMPLFDRRTGAVDPAVARHWSDNYDLARRIASNWSELKADLDGKIHVYAPAIDRYYTFAAARRLEGVLNGLGAKSDFVFIDSHRMDRDFETQAFVEMHAIARPGTTFTPKGVRPYPRLPVLPRAEPISPG